ncbi:MAG TPA: serine/threonine-protein kinase, partial [Kiritimatiellia bacterium]
MAPGTIIRGFRVERRLGQGAMGVVYLATQIAMNRKVALKILPHEITTDASLVHRFLREVQMLARVEHPNIVTAFDAGQERGSYYLAMTYVDGDDLEKRLKKTGKVPELEALEITRKVAEALRYAWEEHKILHNDVKPGNIMIDTRGHVKLMDLGLSKTVLEDTGMSMTGKTFGTPNYMSPEQAQGSKHLDTRSDQYALGATLYRLVTGVLPHSGTSVVELLTKKLFEPIAPARTHNPLVTDACEHFLEVLMAREPDKRYAQWPDLIADLGRVMRGEQPLAKRPGAGESAIGLETMDSESGDAPPGTTIMKIRPNPQPTKFPTLGETQHIEVEKGSGPAAIKIRNAVIAAVVVAACVGGWFYFSKPTAAPPEPAREKPVRVAKEPAPEPVAAAEPDPAMASAWQDDFGGDGAGFDAAKWQVLTAPSRATGAAVLTGPEMEWGAEGLLGALHDPVPFTAKGGVEANITIKNVEVLSKDKNFPNAGYFDFVLSPDASRTAYVTDAQLAVVRLLAMADGTYAFQVGAKRGRAFPNSDPVWIEKIKPLPDATMSAPLVITLVVLPQN